MIQSMTGYSRATRRVPSGLVTVELRSTNHRYLEVGHRLPDGAVEWEERITQLIRSRLRRGRIEANVTVQLAQGAARRVIFDEALGRAYYERLLEMKTRFGLQGGVTLDHVLALPHVLSVTENQAAQRQALWGDIQRALEAALTRLVARRCAEGRRLVKDIQGHLRTIKKRLADIRARLPKSIAQQRQYLSQRLGELTGKPMAASNAKLQEVLAVVRDTDIHEELVRLDSHLAHAQQALGGTQSVGKTLDFIAQELTRETNTIGAKANDAAIARCVIEIKGAIEKIREQAQNLE